MFDTTLTRACGPPQALYLLLGNRLHHRGQIACTPETFARARAQAEADVWRREGGLDANVRLADFYREVVVRLHLGDDAIQELATAELELESELLRPTPQARELIRRWSDRGYRLAFTSDTYFDSDFIAAQLRVHGLWVDGAEVYASTEYPVSKDGGGLFDVVREHLKVAPEALLHIGDNPRSDIAMAEVRGIRTRHLDVARLNRYEELLGGRRWATGGLSAAFAGASRLARLQSATRGIREAAICAVAAGVAAPLLISFVLWVLQRATDQGLRRVYFISRDGQVMADMASRLVERLGYDLEVRYLYASRDSVNLAATFTLDDDEVSWIARDLEHLTTRQVLARFDIEVPDVVDVLAAAGLEPDTPAQPQILALLRENTSLRDLALTRAGQRRNLVADYLRQEGVTKGDSALVDFGGVGSQMRALHTVLTDAEAEPPKMFLIGLDDPLQAGLPAPVLSPPWLQDTECYLYDHRRQHGIRRPRGFGTCVQMFCAADHGTVTGYERQGSRILPVLTEDRDATLMSWGLKDMRTALTAVADHLLVDPELVDLTGDMREPVVRVIDEFWSSPTEDEAQAWGAFPFEGAQAADAPREALAHRYQIHGVVRGLLRRTFPNLGWMHWYEGSLRLSSPAIRGPLRSLERSYRRLERSPHPLAQTVIATFRRLLGRNNRR